MTAPENVEEDRRNSFCIARTHAIERYSTLEQTLCSLFSIFSDTTNIVAAILFFKMNNAQYRRAILKKLMRKKLDSKYNIFFDSYLKFVQELDEQRNKIVHWCTVTNVDHAGFTYYNLRAPGFWYDIEDDSAIRIENLLEFENKCFYISRLGNMFYLVLKMPFKYGQEDNIFLEKVDYPPPVGHPLA